MTERAIVAEDLRVEFRPYVDRQPTLRRSLAQMRHKQVRTVVALDGVSFEVAKGEAFGVIGHNGAGKSTLLRVLARTLLPDSGRVTVNGTTSTLLSLGVGFNPELSGRRNVYLGGLAAGVSKARIDETFEDVVAYAELEEAIDLPLKTYSSGMFARLGFSVAMHLHPDILLLDEVLAVGDERFQRKSRAAMQDLLDEAGTIVFVSHAMKNVIKFCDRVMWLDHGRVKEIGPAETVVPAYQASMRDEQIAAHPARPESDKPWTANRKTAAVIRLLEGEDVDELAEELDVSAARLTKWRGDFVTAGRRALRAGAPPAGAGPGGDGARAG